MPSATAIPSPLQATEYLSWTRIGLPNPAPKLETGVYAEGIVQFRGGYVAIGETEHGCCENGQSYLNQGLEWTSTDGRHWQLHEIAALHGASFTGLMTDGSHLFASGHFFAGPNIGGAAMWVSPDGAHWTRSTGVVPDQVERDPNGLIGVAIAASRDNGGRELIRFMRSTDGLHWTTTSPSYPVIVQGLAIGSDGSGLALGVADGPLPAGISNGDPVAFRSLDGSSWSGPERFGNDQTLGLIAAGSGFLRIASGQVMGQYGPLEHETLWRIVGSAAPEEIDLGVPADAFSILDRLAGIGEVVIVEGQSGSQGATWLSTDGGVTFGQLPETVGEAGVRGIVTPTGLLTVGSDGEPSAPAVWLIDR